MKPILFLGAALLFASLGAPAMERLDALSQIESQDNDRAVGSHHEVSRYQILPEFWTRYWAGNKSAGRPRSPTDPATARRAVTWIMEARCRVFAARYHRDPDDFEYYILWHRPACYIGRPIPRPISTTEAERGRRFASLCQSGAEVAMR